MIRCLFGGPAPCFDDLCHGGGQTVCGLDMDFEQEMEEEIYGRDDEDDEDDDPPLRTGTTSS
jgi:hypothetical protein